MFVVLFFCNIENANYTLNYNKYSRLVGMAKDISAGAVMFATFIAVAIGLIMFGTALYSLI
ncbi:hypothetical protein DBY21_06985 [Candidatus Gastranaerophilales bacterium]|nr:MAG: hypothetical protein DBY21_06985 [Candidatus Gastranaerophilales bacterium]